MTVGVSNIYPPKNWTHYANNNTLNEWLNIRKDGANPVPVHITVKDEGMEIETLLQQLWGESLAGIGKDAKQSGYRRIRITKIERIENLILLEIPRK